MPGAAGFSPGRFSAALAALLLMLQDHFILYSRVGTMDTALSAAYLGTLWHYAAALEPSEAKPGRQMLAAGLCFAAAVLIKSWFAFLLLPALVLAGPSSISKRGLYLPALLALALWMGLYSAEFGAAFWRHEIFENLGQRMAGGAVVSGLQGQSPWAHAAVLQRPGPGRPALSLAPGSPGPGPPRPRGQARRPGAASAHPADFRAELCWSPHFFQRAPDQLRHAPSPPWLRSWERELSVLKAACAGWARPSASWWLGASRAMLRHPSDPNRAIVDAVMAHPARFEGEPLLYAGEHTDARVLEFYSRYRVPRRGRPAQEAASPGRPGARGPQGLIFYPSLSGSRPLSVPEEAAVPFVHPDPNRPAPLN